MGIAVPLILYLWLFATPVGYPLSSVPQGYRSWFLLNPDDRHRREFSRRRHPRHRAGSGVLAVPVLVAIILLPLAYVFFKRVEATMADVI